MNWVAALLLLWCAGECMANTPLAWRREYNQVVASIDTLTRLNGDQDVEALVRQQGNRGANVPLVLLFWADDEAEIFINGFRIAETRLTPTQVEIPALYLRDMNHIRAHCWDTDKVESGFMAGLYARDASGGLRPVLVTSEGPWRIGERRAEVRFYSNTQPDIPGAEVIWGDGLYGEVWLEAEFSAQAIQQAMQRPAVEMPAANQQSMEAHAVLSRIVQLQTRQKELEVRLGASAQAAETPRYKGYVSGRLGFSLGRAGRLAERENRLQAEALYQWAQALPAQERALVFRPPRQLKGAEAAVQRQSLAAGGSEGRADRRKDYLPPPERAPQRAGQTAAAFAVSLPAAGRAMAWLSWTALIGLLGYAAAAGRHWWSLFTAEDWKR